jgi:hypothetical protein
VLGHFSRACELCALLTRKIRGREGWREELELAAKMCDICIFNGFFSVPGNFLIRIVDIFVVLANCDF